MNCRCKMQRRWKLTKIRKEMGLYQRDIAKRLGVTRAGYTNIELGVRTPSLREGKAIADILGITLDAFYEALEVGDQEAG